MTSNKKKSDYCSVIKRLIMQHVMEERPDFAALAENIRSHKWVIMKDLPGAEEDANEVGQYMCEVVHAHGEFAIVRVCYRASEPYTPSARQFVIHLSRWAEYFVKFHIDYYNFADAMGSTSPTTTVIPK